MVVSENVLGKQNPQAFGRCRNGNLELRILCGYTHQFLIDFYSKISRPNFPFAWSLSIFLWF